MISHDVARRLASAIAPRKESDAPEVSSGTVTRTDTDGTVWVRLFGADDDTPCTGSTAAAKPGDVVTVTIDGGSARVDGNVTAPATDDARADEAVRMTERVAEDVVEVRESAASANAAAVVARVAASEAQAVAEATGQHFWADDSGIHVTEAEGNAATEHNILVNSLGFLLRSALNNLASITQGAVAFFDGTGNEASNIMAQFGATLARIGKQAAAHVDVSSSGMEVFTDPTTSVASFGATTRIGKASAAHMVQTGTTTEFYDENDDLKLEVGTTAEDGYALIRANDLLEIVSNDGPYSRAVISHQSNMVRLSIESLNGGILNSLTLFADSSGDPSYTVASPSAFRNAISAAGVGNQSTQNVAFGSGSGTTQQWTIVSNVNSSNTAYGGDRSALIVQDDTVRLLDSTTDTALWSAITTATAPSTSTNVSNVITAASGRTVSQCTYAEWGHVAQLSVTCSGFSASTGSQTVGTVVSGKRPVYAVYATGITSANAPYASLAANGTLSVYWGTAPSTSANYTVRFVYLLA